MTRRPAGVEWDDDVLATAEHGAPLLSRGRLLAGYRDASFLACPDTATARIAAARARSHAAARGWLPPAAWDDDLIDIPDDQLPAELARRVALNRGRLPGRLVRPLPLPMGHLRRLLRQRRPRPPSPRRDS